MWGICGTTKPVDTSSAPALANRAHSAQYTRRYDCSHPRCMFLPQCTPRSKCRSFNCRIHPPCMFLPKCTSCSKCRRLQQRCRNCAFGRTTSNEDVQSVAARTRCMILQADGTRCGRVRRQSARARARRNRLQYTCGDCQVASDKGFDVIV